ncbi:cytosine permease [Thermobispora bispora]|jgi:cytosine permease|uniref:Permease for cytosine/purines uracil thiamine allantoin n=1 Tax=Thermobispora bispora (strain ATCC 19993 / DSM 43833 / CBS 139.67 / JCM 10125 / KCTC 9307 / NBRC 14880 / R51) TaxID=469371 RepID=D6Y4A0_THEBD|nr:cytosine permease [Thermobispora bispora]MBO2475882.1 cytosine permease [Actinomycetales bacterium]MDI9581189.1 cytosine permease [Thermobispora sp.]ADG87154.1 permease for cytosine/purines uracil thiamine allantoin [Thermobispora bispora DSM 43833]MBX6166498.1 cytosine permease [Thermobispora bispora]QSI47118.1 cytosine permease [Thermobispora bispora]
MASALGNDDYAISRVPLQARYSWWSVAVQRFGQLSALSQFLLGATLGFGMTFWESFWAITFGAVILEVVAIALGVIGMREGMSTSMLARWCGFGQAGSALIGLAIGISLVGWFGIQSGVSAEGLYQLLPVMPVWAWSLVFGLAVTAIVVKGFHSMAWTAYLTVPAFMLLVAWSIGSELANHSLADLVASAPAGPRLSLLEGTTLVAGGFIVGAVITPDMTRYNRSVGDVIKQTLVGITLGEYVIGLAGVLLAHAVKSANIVTIVTSTVGLIGVLVIVTGTLKINDWNLYSSGLGVVNFIGTVFGRQANRAVVTLCVGVVGSVLAAAGILERFTDFLTLLGVTFPPIAGIMIAEYFVVRTWRRQLTATNKAGTMPAEAPRWVPATLVIWLIASAIGKFVTWGLPSINSLVAAFALYVIAGWLGLIRGYGTAHTESVESGAAQTSAPSAS